MNDASRTAYLTAARRSRRSSSPLFVGTTVWLAVLASRHLPLVEFAPLRQDVLMFLFGAYVIFVCGYLAAAYALSRGPVRSAPVLGRPLSLGAGLRYTILFFALAGSLGALLRGIDMFALRGLDFSGGVSAARLENIAAVESAGAGARPLSAIGRLLTGCATVSMLAAFLRYESIGWRLRLIASAAWVLALLLSILEGGRNTVVVNIIMLLAAGLVRCRCGRMFLPFPRWARSALKLGMLAAGFYVVFVFTDRFAALGYTDRTVIDGIENAYSVTVSPWVRELPPGPTKNLTICLIMLIIYPAHGLDQIGPILDWLNRHELGHGRYNLDLVALSLARLGLPIERFPFDELPSPGLYVTALGELLLDVGRVATLACIGTIGAAMGGAWRVTPRRAWLARELLLCFGIAWIAASPLYSIVSGFLGVPLAMAVFQCALFVYRSIRRIK